MWLEEAIQKARDAPRNMVCLMQKGKRIIFQGGLGDKRETERVIGIRRRGKDAVEN